MIKNIKWLNWSNMSTAILIIFVGIMLISPSAKGVVIQGLMKIGLFQPDVPTKKTAITFNNKNSSIEGVLFRNEKGEVVNLSELRGKVVFINFWATWCPPCVAEMPSINNLKERFKNNTYVVILMVDADNNPEKSQKFMKRKNYNLEVFTPASPIPEDLFGTSLPTTVLLNKKGQIVFRHEGGADYANKEFQDYVEKLSKE